MVTRIYTVPEYRLVVPGPAVSFRSQKAKGYKSLIRKMARPLFSHPLRDSTVEVRLDYFYRARRRVDMDNVAKCVLDALNRIAYVDDRQVRLQSATGYSLLEPVRIRGGPVDLIKPLAQYGQYLFVRIRGSA
jgi:Holliday junction resolvase RusA-like endonuclease